MLQTFYAHWSQVPMDLWRWPNFSPEELACRGDGTLKLDFASLDKLQALRTALGKPMIINSAYRSETYNKKIGGAKSSQHILAKAFDVSMANFNPAEFEAAAAKAEFTGFGHYVSQNFMHIDTGPARRWTGSDGKYFPTKPTATPQFTPEKKPDTIIDAIKKPEVLGPAAGAAVSMSQGTGPVQIALALSLGALVVYFIWRAVTKNRHEREA